MIETKSQAVSEEVSWSFRRADNDYADDETTLQAVSKEAHEAQMGASIIIQKVNPTHWASYKFAHFREKKIRLFLGQSPY